jgi:hypothetical protein
MRTDRYIKLAYDELIVFYTTHKETKKMNMELDGV